MVIFVSGQWKAGHRIGSLDFMVISSGPITVVDGNVYTASDDNYAKRGPAIADSLAIGVPTDLRVTTRPNGDPLYWPNLNRNQPQPVAMDYNDASVYIRRLYTWRPLCGNGVIDPGETFDEGQPWDGSELAANCGATCGDAVHQSGEGCDDANDIETDSCHRPSWQQLFAAMKSYVRTGQRVSQAMSRATMETTIFGMVAAPTVTGAVTALLEIMRPAMMPTVWKGMAAVTVL